MKKQPSLAEVVKGAEKSVAKQQRAVQARQSFSGALKVEVDQVYVGKKDGLRALEFLRHARPLKAG